MFTLVVTVVVVVGSIAGVLITAGLTHDQTAMAGTLRQGTTLGAATAPARFPVPPRVEVVVTAVTPVERPSGTGRVRAAAALLALTAVLGTALAAAVSFTLVALTLVLQRAAG